MALVGSPIGKPWGQRLPVSVGVAGLIYATWNPADKGTIVTLSNGNLTASNTNPTNRSAVRGTVGKTTGLWKFEIVVNAGTNVVLGAAASSIDLNEATSGLGTSPLGNAIGYESGGQVRTGNVTQAIDPTYGAGDTISVEINAATRAVVFQRLGSARSGTYTMAGTGPIFPAVQVLNGDQVTANFGASAWAITPSSGYVGWS